MIRNKDLMKVICSNILDKMIYLRNITLAPIDDDNRMVDERGGNKFLKILESKPFL